MKEKIDNWIKEKKLGEGQFGEVWKVWKKDEVGALKSLKKTLQEDKEALDSFKKEIKKLKKLKKAKEYIVQIKDCKIKGANIFYVMEYMEGGTLREKMKNMEKITEITSNNIEKIKYIINDVLLPICKGLNFAHRQKIYHRDLKPENLLFDKWGRIKISDWGLGVFVAKQSMSKTGTWSSQEGTPGYCSPEQWEGAKPSACQDIYSLGVIFYELITKELPPPFECKEKNTKFYMFYRPKINPPLFPSINNEFTSLNNKINKVIFKMIKLDFKKRYKNINEIIKELNDINNKLKNFKSTF